MSCERFFSVYELWKILDVPMAVIVILHRSISFISLFSCAWACVAARKSPSGLGSSTVAMAKPATIRSSKSHWLFFQGRLSCFASMQSPLIKRISSSKSLCCKEPWSRNSHVGMFNMSSTKCHLIWKTHWQGFTGNIKDSGSAKFPFMPSLGNDSPLHPSSTRCHLGLIEAYQLFLPLWHENDMWYDCYCW